MIYKFREWEFEVDNVVTRKTYDQVSRSGAEECECNNCKNYVAYRERVFPKEVVTFFSDIGVDYRKEIEITDYQRLPNGLHHIGGWFHFKGQILSGKDCRVFTDDSKAGWTFDLTSIDDMFSMGFCMGSDLAYFEDNAGLVQVEFETKIPWVIDKALEGD
jgi:hypothetical protein